MAAEKHIEEMIKEMADFYRVALNIELQEGKSFDIAKKSAREELKRSYPVAADWYSVSFGTYVDERSTYGRMLGNEVNKINREAKTKLRAGDAPKKKGRKAQRKEPLQQAGATRFDYQSLPLATLAQRYIRGESTRELASEVGAPDHKTLGKHLKPYVEAVGGRMRSQKASQRTRRQKEALGHRQMPGIVLHPSGNSNVQATLHNALDALSLKPGDTLSLGNLNLLAFVMGCSTGVLKHHMKNGINGAYRFEIVKSSVKNFIARVLPPPVSPEPVAPVVAPAAPQANASRKVQVVGAPAGTQSEWRDWYTKHYPGVEVEFVDLPAVLADAPQEQAPPKKQYGFAINGVTIPNPTGKWFHSFYLDGIRKGNVRWQGQVLRRVDTDTYAVQLYEWLLGEPTDEVVVHAEEMAGWCFYHTSGEMNAEYKNANQLFDKDQSAKGGV